MQLLQLQSQIFFETEIIAIVNFFQNYKYCNRQFFFEITMISTAIFFWNSNYCNCNFLETAFIAIAIFLVLPATAILIFFHIAIAFSIIFRNCNYCNSILILLRNAIVAIASFNFSFRNYNGNWFFSKLQLSQLQLIYYTCNYLIIITIVITNSKQLRIRKKTTFSSIF